MYNYYNIIALLLNCFVYIVVPKLMQYHACTLVMINVAVSYKLDCSYNNFIIY